MKKNKYLGTFILLVCLLLCSISFYCYYPNIKSQVQKANTTKEIQDYMLTKTSQFDYVLQEKIRPSLTPYDQFFKFSNKKTEYLQAMKQENTDNFENLNSLLSQENIYHYVVTDNKTKKTTSNTKNNISNIQNDKKLQEQYQIYYQIVYDEYGNHTISFTNINKDTLESYLISNDNVYNDDVTIDTTESQLRVLSPTNITITYAISKNIQPYTAVSYKLAEIEHSQYEHFTIPFIILGILFSMIVTLFIPIKYLKENPFFKAISNIKFEFISLLLGFALAISIMFSFSISLYTMNNQIINIYKNLGIETMQNYLTPILNIGAYFITFLIASLIIYMIKFIFHKGIKNYCRDYTVIGWIYIQLKTLINHVLNFDFEDNINKVTLKIVGVNFIVMSVLCIFFVAGPFLSLIYSILLFIILNKKFHKIKEDYEVLLENTEQLSQGNFDLDLDKDIGIFNPLRERFSHIKKGFESAVHEEVKSQKTKTELISNVSHDLKTPLTSIITYIDILKNPDITNEQREEYIEILDRNSLRLKNLIEDLFEVSKASSGDIKLDYVDIDIISLIKQAQLECQDQFDSHHLDLRTSFSNEKIICNLDSSKTYRILENLLVNATKYALEGTRVYLDVVEKDNLATITLKNISKDEMRFNENEILERFVQGDESRNTSGSGLGLSIVKSFTDVQGGTFKIELDGDLFKAILQFKTKK